MSALNYLFEELAKNRSRSSWNDRLTHWEKPASDSEVARIERAASMVRDALSASAWLTTEGVTVAPQGSYYNNTNVRQTADQDLRAVHPGIRIECDNGIDRAVADRCLGTSDTGRTFADLIQRMRSEIDAALSQKFGARSLDTSGTKATRVLELPGSRAPVDVVACFRYFWVMHGEAGHLTHAEGISILDKKGSWTNNFPDQHHANGIAKRANTQHRFKKVVRSLKRLRDELVEAKIIIPKQAPSFLIECLVYAVEDAYFLLTEPDERYDRVLQVVERMDALLANREWIQKAMEINGIKYLFWPTQPWTAESARQFVQAAHARLLGI